MHGTRHMLTMSTCPGILMLTVTTLSHWSEAAMTSMKRALETLWNGDRRVPALGLARIGLLAATGIALFVDPRQIPGAPAWLKPAKFAASIAIYTLTLAW